jgi:hypothetical protein
VSAHHTTLEHDNHPSPCTTVAHSELNRRQATASSRADIVFAMGVAVRFSRSGVPDANGRRTRYEDRDRERQPPINKRSRRCAARQSQ